MHEILGSCFQSARVQAGDACAQKMISAAASKFVPYVYKSNKGSLLQFGWSKSVSTVALIKSSKWVQCDSARVCSYFCLFGRKFSTGWEQKA